MRCKKDLHTLYYFFVANTNLGLGSSFSRKHNSNVIIVKVCQAQPKGYNITVTSFLAKWRTFDDWSVSSEFGDICNMYMGGHKTEEVLSVKDKCRMGGFFTMTIEPFLCTYGWEMDWRDKWMNYGILGSGDNKDKGPRFCSCMLYIQYTYMWDLRCINIW
jgi:hypothetical protein